MTLFSLLFPRESRMLAVLSKQAERLDPLAQRLRTMENSQRDGAINLFRVRQLQKVLASEIDSLTAEARRLEAVAKKLLSASEGKQFFPQKEYLTPTTWISMKKIPAGEFLMGSPESEAGRCSNEGPQHTVTLKAFFLAQTPITQAQWRAVAQWQPGEGEEPWALALDPDPVAKLRQAERFTGEQRPVVNVSWHEAMEFCRRLSRIRGHHYTLPSEAQWEYACRAGSSTPFAFGETLTPELANYSTAVDKDGAPTYGLNGQTTDVVRFPANAWGLHDMHGNVWEWCADDWHGSYDGAPEDGTDWLEEESPGDDSVAKTKKSGQWKPLRGGSWLSPPRSCRSAFRCSIHPVARGSRVGFRVCCLPRGWEQP